MDATKRTRFEAHRAGCVRCQIPGYRCTVGWTLIDRDAHPEAWEHHSEAYAANAGRVR